MNSFKLIALSLVVISFGSRAARAECSFEFAAELTRHLIQVSSQSAGGYAYTDLKIAESRDERTRITEVLFTFNAQFSAENPSSQTMVGYAHYDDSCRETDSLITVAGISL